MTDFQSVFSRVVRDPRYLRGLDWGEPRAGHPEGTIRAHIEELDRNIELLRAKLTSDQYWRARVLVHTHDTFKGEATPGVAIRDPRSHASLARAFLAEFCDDADVLAMVQRHDEPYALWLKARRGTGSIDASRLEGLVIAIRDWDLFLAFLIVDGSTAGKSRDPLRWFFRELQGRVRSAFNESHIIEA